MDLGSAYDRAMQEKIFDPLGMKSTTFNYAKALAGNHASPHGDDVDGKPVVADKAFNYSIIPARPAGGVWTSAHDFIRYLQLELTLGKYGIPVVSHGGSMAGFKTNFILLPESGVGALILTNSDAGGFVEGPFSRRLLEILFDGKPEAVADIATAAANCKASRAKDRERLVVPADPATATNLAKHYFSKELGHLDVLSDSGATTFDFGEWKSVVATRNNDDGTISFITIDPTNDGVEFVMGEAAGKRILTLRDAQHEYVFNEVE
jgi:Beta-lactamase